jgi:hypothetical protein
MTLIIHQPHRSQIESDHHDLIRIIQDIIHTNPRVEARAVDVGAGKVEWGVKPETHCWKLENNDGLIQ